MKTKSKTTMFKSAQSEFGFVSACVAAWVRPAVLSLRFWNKTGERDGRMSYDAWLMWHAPLNGGAR